MSITMNNGLTFEPDAIELIDENNAMQGWAAVVNIYCSDDTPGNLIIGRERYPTEAAARLAAIDLCARERRRVEYLYTEAI